MLLFPVITSWYFSRSSIWLYRNYSGGVTSNSIAVCQTLFFSPTHKKNRGWPARLGKSSHLAFSTPTNHPLFFWSLEPVKEILCRKYSDRQFLAKQLKFWQLRWLAKSTEPDTKWMIDFIACVLINAFGSTRWHNELWPPDKEGHISVNIKVNVCIWLN